LRQQGLEKVATADAKLTPLRRAWGRQLLEAWGPLEARVAPYDAQVAQVAQAHPGWQRYAMPLRAKMGASVPPGSGWSPDNPALVGRRAGWA
jgi:hypothetical protein